MKKFHSDFIRERIRNYNQFYRFEFNEYNIDLSKGKSYIKDSFAEKTNLDKIKILSYYNDLEEYFSNEEKIAIKYNLEIYNDLLKIRSKYIKINDEFNNIPKTDKEITLLNIAFYNIPYEKQNSIRLIWDENTFLQTTKMFRTILIVSESLTQLDLMLAYIEEKKVEKKIILLVKSTKVINEPTYAEVQNIGKKYASLHIKIVVDETDYPFIDPFHEYFNKKELISVLLGELALYRVNDIPGEKLIIGNAFNLLSQCFTNLYEVYGDGIHPYLAHIKKGEQAYKDCILVEKGEYSLYHYVNNIHHNKMILENNYYEYNYFRYDANNVELHKNVEILTLDEPKLQYAKVQLDPKDIESVEFITSIQTDQELVYPRSYCENKSGEYFYINGLYFFTEKLADEYNLNLNKGEKRLDVINFFMDYLYYKENIELLPLFNKAFIGITDDGDIIAGNRKIESARIELIDKTYQFNNRQINPEDTDIDYFMLTPLENNIQEKMSGRYNLIYINNKLQDYYIGNRSVPPTAIVLSFKRFDFSVFDSSNSVDISVAINTPNDILEDEWKKVVIAAGGGTFLYRNGKNFVESYEDQVLSFEQEGWMHENSIKSQETVLHEYIRGPRSIIGKTYSGQILLYSFSGRIDASLGVRFNEIVDYIKTDYPDLDWLINLDGGASSCLGHINHGIFTELNIPCASKYNATGMVRPVNSFFLFKIKSKSE